MAAAVLVLVAAAAEVAVLASAVMASAVLASAVLASAVLASEVLGSLSCLRLAMICRSKKGRSQIRKGIAARGRAHAKAVWPDARRVGRRAAAAGAAGAAEAAEAAEAAAEAAAAAPAERLRRPARW